MLNLFKIFFSKFLLLFKLRIVNSSVDIYSDDPFFIVSKFLDREKVNLIIDGGASIGETSQRFSNLFPNASIHAFEPFPDFYSLLKKKAKLNDKIIPYPLGLGKNDGDVIFHVNKSTGTNSILASNTKSKEIYGELLQVDHQIKIPLTRLDDIFDINDNKSIDILKLDLQGTELDALIGASQLLDHGKINAILCEVMFVPSYDHQPSWVELVTFIEKNNLSLFNIYQRHFYKGQLIQADLLFMRNELLSATEQKRSELFHNYSEIIKSQNYDS